MKAYEELSAPAASGSLPAPILVTRRRRHQLDPPYFPPAYTPLLDAVLVQNALHRRQDRIRQAALHPIRLHAGQSPLPGGELGRPAAREPILVPEMLGGRVLTTNV